MVVGRARRHRVHVERPEVLVYVGLELGEDLLARRVGDLLGVGCRRSTVVGVDVGDVGQLQAVAEARQVGVAHAARVLDYPVDLGAVLHVVRQAALDEVVRVDALAHADERALVRVRAPDGHDRQARVVLPVHCELEPVCRHLGVGLLVGALALLGRAEAPAVGARCPEARVAVLLVEDGGQRVVGVEPPEADARHERARVLVPDRAELARAEDVHVVEVPEREGHAVDERVDAYLLHVVVEPVPKLGLGHVLARLAHAHEGDALAQRVHDALDVEPLEAVARDAQAARGEVAHLPAVDGEQHAREVADRLVSLAEVVVRAHRVAVHLAALVALDRRLDERRRRPRLDELLVGDYGRFRHPSPSVLCSNGDAYAALCLYILNVATP